MKVAVVGAPGSGKTVFSAMLFASLLAKGISSSRLCMEKAAEHLGCGGTIKTIEDQIYVSDITTAQEEYLEVCGFNPIICDGAAWMGAIYMEQRIVKMDLTFHEVMQIDAYYDSLEEHKYDLYIYCPLFRDDDQIGKFRIHNNEQAKWVDQRIQEKLKDSTTMTYWLSNDFAQRDACVNVATEIIIKELKGK